MNENGSPGSNGTNNLIKVGETKTVFFRLVSNDKYFRKEITNAVVTHLLAGIVDSCGQCRLSGLSDLAHILSMLPKRLC